VGGLRATIEIQENETSEIENNMKTQRGTKKKKKGVRLPKRGKKMGKEKLLKMGLQKRGENEAVLVFWGQTPVNRNI